MRFFMEVLQKRSRKGNFSWKKPGAFEKEKPIHWEMLLEPGQVTYQLGKPILELDLTSKTSLVDLLGTNSFFRWDILGLDWQWLKQSPEEWDKSASYQEMKEYVCTAKVTNDCAERGVKV